MTDASMDEFGPVDYLVIEFPAGQATFNGEMAAELAALREWEGVGRPVRKVSLSLLRRVPSRGQCRQGTNP